MKKLIEYSVIIYEKLTEKLTKFIHNIIPDKDIEKTSILFWVISIVIIIAVIWGFIAHIEQVVRAPGTVIPASKIQVVQSVYSGVITKISVIKIAIYLIINLMSYEAWELRLILNR